jgi:hypothetical protein
VHRRRKKARRAIEIGSRFGRDKDAGRGNIELVRVLEGSKLDVLASPHEAEEGEGVPEGLTLV